MRTLVVLVLLGGCVGRPLVDAAGDGGAPELATPDAAMPTWMTLQTDPMGASCYLPSPETTGGALQVAWATLHREPPLPPLTWTCAAWDDPPSEWEVSAMYRDFRMKWNGAFTADVWFSVGVVTYADQQQGVADTENTDPRVGAVRAALASAGYR